MKAIAEIEASFAPSKNNLQIDIQGGSGAINLVTSADQLCSIAKLLLLAGNGKVFKVKFYEITRDNSDTEEDTGCKDL